MRKVFRFEDNSLYWDRRWTEAGRDLDHFLDPSIYPIKYAEMVMDDPKKLVVELGCGLGRVLKHYHYLGFRICGIERSNVAVKRLLTEHPCLNVREGDVLDLPYDDEMFDIALAFGLYHNLEHGFDRALAETARCLRSGGRFCITMRPDNLEMRLNEWYWRWQPRQGRTDGQHFHKWLVNEDDFRQSLKKVGLITESVHRARNVSFLWRFPFLRDKNPASEEESERRARGYRLSGVGRLLDRFLITLFPYQFCNVQVFIGYKR